MYHVRKQNKFGNTRQTYGGYSYMSKKEAAYAQELDLMLKAGLITSWDRQVKIDLRVNGKHICNYYVDFQLNFADGHIELHEVKGYRTALYTLKRKLLEAAYLPDHPEVSFTEIV